MKINKILFLLPLCGLLVFGSCTGNFKEHNTDKYGISDKEAERDLYNIAGALRAMQSAVISTDVNRTHQTDILMGGAYGRYSADSKANSWHNKFSTFDAPDGWSSVMFNEIIPYIYPHYIELLAVADEQPAVMAIADIIKVAAMHRVADTYGPIPYLQLGVPGVTHAPYDSHRDVYMRMFDELDAAIDELTQRRFDGSYRNADMIYRGDLEKWVRFANSLKLRLAMRIVYAEPAMAQAKAEEAIAHEIGTMADNDDNAALSSFSIDGNPLFVAVNYNDGDHRAVADMTVYMNAYNDPRRGSYFNESGFPGGGYHGYRSGIIIGGVEEFINYSTFKIARNTPLQWMNVAEVMFLRAEGALRGWNMGGTAQEFYESGVRLSFDQWGASGVNTYLTNDTGFPDGYVDPAGNFSWPNLLTSVTVNWNVADEANFERSLERIMIQKWLANFPLGQEAWADRRRTGYPRMLPVVVNNSPGGILTADGVPRRLPYPTVESIINSTGYAAAVNMLGGADNIATRLWWDCK